MGDKFTDDIESMIKNARQLRAVTSMPPQLVKYWVAGAGAAKIGWGVPGDFARCITNIQAEVSEKHLPLGDHEIKGLCATLHKMATGATPGHAPGESHGGSSHGHRAGGSAMADAKKPYGDVTYADPGYQQDKKKRYPVDTAAHAKAAWSYINQGDNAKVYSSDQLASIKSKIKAALAKFGVQVSADSARDASWIADVRWTNGLPEQEVARNVPTPSDLFAPRSFVRSYPLEDISIRAGGDGRTVEAYAAVFDTPTEIYDQDGHYNEELDRAVFNRAISDSAPAGGRANWKVGVFYNHGMTLMGTPSDRHSMPIGIPLEIKVEPRGLLTVTRYSRSTLADEILDNIREGSISGYSFSGAFRRSTPAKPRGGWRPDNAGGLTTVRRLESTLREYGPTPFPAYATASVVGMRAAELLQYGYTPQQVQDIVESSYGAPSADSPDPDAPKREDYAGLVTEDSLPERSGRSVKGQMRANRSAFLQRHGRKPHDHQI